MRRIIGLRISGGTYRWRWHYKLMPAMEGEKVSGTMPYYLTPKQDDFNQIPELQVCLAEAKTRQG